MVRIFLFYVGIPGIELQDSAGAQYAFCPLILIPNCERGVHIPSCPPRRFFAYVTCRCDDPDMPHDVVPIATIEERTYVPPLFPPVPLSISRMGVFSISALAIKSVG
jgi:hypothetical protein